MESSIIFDALAAIAAALTVFLIKSVIDQGKQLAALQATQTLKLSTLTEIKTQMAAQNASLELKITKLQDCLRNEIKDVYKAINDINRGGH